MQIYSPFGWRTSSAPPKPTFITLPYPATFNPSITAILPVHITLSRLIISVVTLANLAAISMSGICPLIPMMMRTAALTQIASAQYWPSCSFYRFSALTYLSGVTCITYASYLSDVSYSIPCQESVYLSASAELQDFWLCCSQRGLTLEFRIRHNQ